jgi:hypothetical protein
MFELFITLGIPFLFFEFSVLILPDRYTMYLKDIKDNIKENKIEFEDRAFIAFNFFYFIWTIIGLFTSLWPYFLSITLLSIINFIASKIISSDINIIRWRMIDSLLTIIIIIGLLFELKS